MKLYIIYFLLVVIVLLVFSNTNETFKTEPHIKFVDKSVPQDYISSFNSKDLQARQLTDHNEALITIKVLFILLQNPKKPKEI